MGNEYSGQYICGFPSFKGIWNLQPLLLFVLDGFTLLVFAIFTVALAFCRGRMPGWGPGEPQPGELPPCSPAVARSCLPAVLQPCRRREDDPERFAQVRVLARPSRSDAA